MKIARRIDEHGRRYFSPAEIVELLYRGIDIDGLILDSGESAKSFNNNCRKFQLPCKLTPLSCRDEPAATEWVLPEPYASLDVQREILGRCVRSDEIARVSYELVLYERFGLVDMLRALFYLVDVMRENNIVWGVGRGSSVASYVLFLIGVHKIDSIKFDLNVHDFFKITA